VDQFIQESLQGTTLGGGFGLWEVITALLLSFFMSLVIAYVYRETHQGVSYSVSLVHTMIIMSVTIALIMLIIGSNVARAFALVGALSIIRFRNAIKESRDVAFIFMTMAVGMAAGTGFYLAGIIFTLFVSGMVYFLHRFNIGGSTSREVMVKVHLAEFVDYHTAFDDVFYRYLQEHSLLSVETIRGGTLLELVYSVQFRKGANESKFVDELRAIAADGRVSLLTGYENVIA
jgi:uncharacterized membrane protein YhiD involved in acid resistance